MVLWARMSDWGKDRTIYPANSLFVGAAGLVVSMTDTSPAATIVRLVSIFMIGQIKNITQNFTIPLLAVAGFLLFRSILMIVFGRLAPADLRVKAGAARA